MIFIDVRDSDEAIINIPLPRLKRQIRSLAPQDERIVLLCESGHRSRAAAAMLRELGYFDVCALSLEAFERECIQDDRDRA